MFDAEPFQSVAEVEFADLSQAQVSKSVAPVYAQFPIGLGLEMDCVWIGQESPGHREDVRSK
ncbi:hypothetical protein [Mariniradius sediminis]|uniref:hypothetical protein n=1 Tax=Mariniradius sediminis TaxID=2909237 RepID=UPI001F4274CA|nr:hypothetical protein [Mariniradius sediminis]